MQTELTFSPGRHVAGVDEAGRGPLAGPVVAAAVMLPRSLLERFDAADSMRDRFAQALRFRAPLSVSGTLVR